MTSYSITPRSPGGAPTGLASTGGPQRSLSRKPLPATCPLAASTPSSAAHARPPRSPSGLPGGKDVDLFSASVGGQMLRAGLVEEVRIHLAPVLLGVGTRVLVDDDGHIRLQPTRITGSSKAAHLRYLVLTVDGTADVSARSIVPRPVEVAEQQRDLFRRWIGLRHTMTLPTRRYSTSTSTSSHAGGTTASVTSGPRPGPEARRSWTRSPS